MKNLDHPETNDRFPYLTPINMTKYFTDKNVKGIQVHLYSNLLSKAKTYGPSSQEVNEFLMNNGNKKLVKKTLNKLIEWFTKQFIMAEIDCINDMKIYLYLDAQKIQNIIKTVIEGHINQAIRQVKEKGGTGGMNKERKIKIIQQLKAIYTYIGYNNNNGSEQSNKINYHQKEQHELKQDYITTNKIQTVNNEVFNIHGTTQAQHQLRAAPLQHKFQEHTQNKDKKNNDQNEKQEQLHDDNNNWKKQGDKQDNIKKNKNYSEKKSYTRNEKCNNIVIIAFRNINQPFEFKNYNCRNEIKRFQFGQILCQIMYTEEKTNMCTLKYRQGESKLNNIPIVGGLFSSKQKTQGIYLHQNKLIYLQNTKKIPKDIQNCGYLLSLLCLDTKDDIFRQQLENDFQKQNFLLPEMTQAFLKLNKMKSNTNYHSRIHISNQKRALTNILSYTKNSILDDNTILHGLANLFEIPRVIYSENSGISYSSRGYIDKQNVVTKEDSFQLLDLVFNLAIKKLDQNGKNLFSIILIMMQKHQNNLNKLKINQEKISAYLNWFLDEFPSRLYSSIRQQIPKMKLEECSQILILQLQIITIIPQFSSTSDRSKNQFDSFLKTLESITNNNNQISKHIHKQVMKYVEIIFIERRHKILRPHLLRLLNIAKYRKQRLHALHENLPPIIFRYINFTVKQQFKEWQGYAQGEMLRILLDQPSNQWQRQLIQYYFAQRSYYKTYDDKKLKQILIEVYLKNPEKLSNLHLFNDSLIKHWQQYRQDPPKSILSDLDYITNQTTSAKYKIQNSTILELVFLFINTFMDKKKYIQMFGLMKTIKNQQIRQYLFREVCHEFTKLKEAEKQDIAQKILKKFNQDQEMTSRIYEQLYKDINEENQKIRDRIVEVILTNPSDIKHMKLKYRRYFKNSVEYQIDLVQNLKIQEETLDRILCIQNCKQEQPQQIKQLCQVTKKSKLYAMNVSQSYLRLIQILSKYQQMMENQIIELKQISDAFKQNFISSWLQEKYGNTAMRSEDILIIKKTMIWEDLVIGSYQNLQQEFQSCRQAIGDMIDQLFGGDLTYKNYITVFSTEIIEIVKNLIDDQVNKQIIGQIIYQLSQQNLKLWSQLLGGIEFINSKTKNVQTGQWFSLKLRQVKEPEMLIGNVLEFFQSLVSAKQDFHKLVGLKITQKNEEIIKILLNWEKCEKIFEMIDGNKINSSIIEDLKEYINDLEHSILRLDHVKSFQTVLLFYQIIISSQNIEEFIYLFKKQQNQRAWFLSQAIEDSYCNLAMIQQKIDESKNRQTSFKYDIGDIFNSSTVHLKIQNYSTCLFITTNYNQDDLTEKKERTFQMKALQSFKDKSLLLVTDSRRQKIEDVTTINIIELLKDYLILFNKIQTIDSQVKQLLNYGYNPDNIERTIEIRNQDFSQLDQTLDSFAKISKIWIQKVKTAYDGSYILTHFVGQELYLLLDKLAHGTFCEELEDLFGITAQQFEQIYQEQKSEDQDIKDPLNKLGMVENILQKLSLELLTSRISNKLQNHPIELITCKEQSEYYCYLTESGKLPKINQVLYCQEETSLETIQCFLKRAILKNTEKHYILAVHYLSIQKQHKFCDLLNSLVRRNHHKFKQAQLCFIDRSIVQKVYIHLCRGEIFWVKKISMVNIEEKKIRFVKLLQNIQLIASESPGQGKTYHAEKMARINNVSIKYFLICGNVNFSNLSKRLRNLDLKENDILLIQIGHVENRRKLEVFLSQLIMFKAFNYEGFQFLSKNVSIFIEIQNILDSNLEDQGLKNKIPKQYETLKTIRDEGSKYIYLRKFDLEFLDINLHDEKQHFVMVYLDKFENRQINNSQQISYTEFHSLPFEQRQHISIQRIRYLLKMHFLNKLHQQPTYRLYKYFIRLFFEYVSTFSNSIFFNVQFLQEDHNRVRILELNRVRESFLEISIRNAIQFLEETQNTNQFRSNQGKADFRSKLEEFPLLIMPTYDKQGFQFVYLDDRKVYTPIKSLKLSQQTNLDIWKRLNNITNIDKLHDLFHQGALNNLIGQNLEMEIYNFINRLSNSQKFRVLDPNQAKRQKISQKQSLLNLKQIYPDLQSYSLTLDNFFKMCLIIQRMRSHLPIVLMGESGVGKTALIKFLAEVIFNEIFLCFNVHAGINEERLAKWAEQIFEKTKEADLQNKKVWVFFDEFNTTDELSYIKQMIIDRRFQGRQFPDNTVFLAACNPFRRKKVAKHKCAGLKKIMKQPRQNLAFKVKLPPESMISVMWDYQQLRERQNFAYISKMLEVLSYQKNESLVHTITIVHEFLKTRKQISSVSLRDVYRFRQIASWFLECMPTQKNNKKQKGNKELQNPNYKMNSKDRAIILSLGFCYGMRLSENDERSQLFQLIEKTMSLNNTKVQKVLQNEQIDYVSRMTIPNQKIALNKALRENVFVILVSIMNKIPVLIVGNPGNSKSLSIRMLASNLRGANSTNEFCRKLPEFNMVYFQGSQACTSKGIQQVFQKVKSSRRQFIEKFKDKKEFYKPPQNCIYFDQIGLAEKSVHNPLKVLHAELQTNNKQICFIGISNWQLDASKMSRFLILARSTPNQQQLEDTALKILLTYTKQPPAFIQNKFKELAGFYYQFIQQWDRNQNIDGFFGLRDFYCYIKYICERVIENKQNLEQVIFRSIAINFDGQPGSLQLFYRISNIKDYQVHKIDPIEIINNNLESPSSRCLLLIIRGDALVPLINRNLKINQNQRNVICMYGSTFKNDKSSEEYNLQITSLIISHISRGNILTFKDINSSIQTSLYDLFNKSFYEVGTKKYCRIAVGANLNPKCLVHKDFNAIVYIDESNVVNTDLAFLNRFQKHYLNLRSVTHEGQQTIINSLIEWIDGVLSFTSKTRFKRQNFILNCCEESIVTLALKYREISSEEQRIHLIKKQLLWNSTMDLKIALNYRFIEKNYHDEIQNLLSEIQSEERQMVIQNYKSYSEERMYHEQQMEQQVIHKKYSQQEGTFSNLRSSKIRAISDFQENMLIFTYDQNLDSVSQYHLCTEKTHKFRLSSVKGQKQLRQQLDNSIRNPQFDNLHIIVNYERQNQHLDLLLFICEGMQAVQNKRIIIIVQISRFSLINDKINVINISYLHKFRQAFIEDLSITNKTQRLLKISSMYELLGQFRFDQISEISEIYVKSLQYFNFRENLQVFKAAHHLESEQFFLEKALQYVTLEARKQEINYEFLLLMKDQASFCASIYQAIREHALSFISKRLIAFTNFIFKQSLIYLFNYNQNINENEVIGPILFQCKQQYFQIVSNALDINMREINPSKISMDIQGNLLPKIEKHIFPLFSREKKFIFSKNEDESNKIQSLAKKMLKLHGQNSNEQNQFRQDVLIKEIQQIFKKNSWMNFEQLANKLGEKFKYIQILYLYDFFVSAFVDETKLSLNAFASIAIYFSQELSHFSIIEKIVTFLADRKIFGHLLQSMVSVSDEKDKLMEYFGGQAELVDYPIPQMIKISMKVTHIHQLRMFISKQIVQQLTPKQYFKKFNSTYFYLQKIRILFQVFDVRIPSQLKICKKLLDLFGNISETEKQKQILLWDFAHLQQSEGSLQLKINQFLVNIRENKPKDQTKAIDTYLCLQVYPQWIKNEKQEELCTGNFIKLANKSADFANNGVQFFEYILSDFTELDYLEKWQFAANSPKPIQQLMNHITFQDNFSVALGNFLNLQFELDQQDEETLFSKFQAIQQNNDSQNQFEQLMNIQFCKNYVVYNYLNSLEENIMSEYIENIDNILCSKSKLSEQLRIYLIKNLINIYQDPNQIKQEYIDKSKCKWILLCQDLLETKKIGLLIPPKAKNSNLTPLIDNLIGESYQNMKILHQIVKKSYESVQNKFQFLNFLLVNCYSRVCPQQNLREIEKQLSQRQDLNMKNNTLELQIIRGYLTNQITPEMGFKKETTQQQFQDRQLFQLSVINFFISCRFIKCPLIQIFFDMHGKVPVEYSNWIQERFLPCGKENLSASIIRVHLQTNKNTNLHHCSNQCDYIYDVGQCMKPMEESHCPWCKKVIGGKDHKYTRQAEGARPIVKAQMDKQLAQIREKKTIRKDGADIKLLGYTLGQSTQIIVKEIEDNERIHKIGSKFIFLMMGTFWDYLISTKNIKIKEMNKIFGIPPKQWQEQLRKVMVIFNKQLSDKLNINGQQFLVWKLGIIAKLVTFVSNYYNNFQPAEMRENIGLKIAYHRDKLQQMIQKQILIYVGARQRTDLIQQSLSLREQQLDHSSNLVRQLCKPDYYFKKYPLIRHIKLAGRIEMESFRQDYSEALKKTHPILSFTIQKQHIFKQIKQNAIIFQFTSKLIQMTSFKVTREEASRIGFLKLIREQDVDVKQMAQIYRKFVHRWNQISKDKTALTDRCNQLGILETIDEDNYESYPIANFLPDREHPQNLAGFKMLSLLRVKAEEYNQALQGVMATIKKIGQYRYDPLFNSETKNIMNILNFEAEKLAYCTQDEVWKLIENYSSLSVQYGIKTPNYPLDKIQSVLVDNYFSNKKFIQSERQKIQTVSYAGELSLLIFKVTEMIPQVRLEFINKKSQIENHLILMKRKSPDTFHKYLKKLLGQIELIMFYCKNLKPAHSIKFEQFLSKSHFTKTAGQLMVEPYKNLPLSTLVDLYQTIQSKTFEQVEFRLDKCYCDNLEKPQKENLTEIKKLLQQKTQSDYLNELTITLYRFTTRMLFMMKVGPDISLTDWIGQQQFWPKRVPFFEIEILEDSLRIPIRKMGAILKFFNENIKKSVEESLETAQKTNIRKQQRFERPKKKVTKTRNMD